MTDTDDAGYTFFCYCGHGEAWTNEAAAMAASVWHVYQAHHGPATVNQLTRRRNCWVDSFKYGSRDE